MKYKSKEKESGFYPNPFETKISEVTTTLKSPKKESPWESHRGFNETEENNRKFRKNK